MFTPLNDATARRMRRGSHSEEPVIVLIFFADAGVCLDIRRIWHVAMLFLELSFPLLELSAQPVPVGTVVVAACGPRHDQWCLSPSRALFVSPRPPNPSLRPRLSLLAPQFVLVDSLSPDPQPGPPDTSEPGRLETARMKILVPYFLEINLEHFY